MDERKARGMVAQLDAIAAGSALARRDQVLDVFRAHPEGVSLEQLHHDDSGVKFDAFYIVVRLCAHRQIERFLGPDSRWEYVMPGDPWYKEPKQQFMRKVVLQLLQNHVAGHSRRDLISILSRRDKDCDAAYTTRLMARMRKEGVVILVDGTEQVMERLVDPQGWTHQPQGITTLNSVPVERAARVFRLSSGRWLKDTAREGRG